MTGSVRGHCLKAHQAKAWCALHSGHDVKQKINSSVLSKLAHKYGLKGNEGIIWTAQRIARIRGDAVPGTKQQCRAYLISQDGGSVALGDRPKAPRVFHRRKREVLPTDDAFLLSYEWRQVRMQALKRDGARCCCCGATPADGRVMHVDHIKPRKHFPQLALDLNNLQVLCDVCNHGKGNWDQTDWREDVIGAKLRVIK